MQDQYFIDNDVSQKIKQKLIESVEESRPDRIKADYERVMREAGLLPKPPKIWLPSQ